jgi:hypothetical protein
MFDYSSDHIGSGFHLIQIHVYRSNRNFTEGVILNADLELKAAFRWRLSVQSS